VGVKRAILVSALIASLTLLAACGGGGDDSNGSSSTGTPGASVTARRTGTAQPSGTGTAEAGTPAAQATTDPNGPDGVPDSGDEPVPVDIGGGDPNAQPEIVATVPPVTPKAGITPIVDPTEIAEPQVQGELHMVIDLDAATPGIQATRDVNVGDTIRVGVVIVNAPQHVNDLGGISAFNWVVNYDKTKIVAPTIAGGLATQRNPFANIAAVGGAAANWDCLPAPEGDLDDPGGIDGDGDPNTGQAFLSCFSTAGVTGGTIVLGVVTFQAIAPGSVNLTLSQLSVGDLLGTEFATCPVDTGPAKVPCDGATLNVK
jgi:hypothetical protein